MPPGTVISVNISNGGIPKLPLARCDVHELGLAGDAHNHPKHGGPIQAVCLLDMEQIEQFREGHAIDPGTVGENLTLSGVNVQACTIGDRLVFAGGLELEISKIRKPCYTLDPISPELKTTAIGKIGWYARVIRPAAVAPGETVQVHHGNGVA